MLNRSTKAIDWYASATTQRTAGAISTVNNIIINNIGYVHIALTKNANVYKLYANGVEISTGTISLTYPTTAKIYLGNSPNWTGAATGFAVNTQGSFNVDGFRITDRVRQVIVPSTTADFNTYLQKYHYAEDCGLIIKTDKNVDTSRQGDFIGTNTNWHFNTAAYTYGNVVDQATNPLTLTLASEGLQVLDYNDANSTLTLDSETISSATDVWSTRTATIPAIGGRKVKANTTTYGKFYIRTVDTTVADNILRFSFNQAADYNVGSILSQVNSSGQTLGTARIVD